MDLFAGSGALGIEALSRGAKETTFVERDERAAKIIEANLKACRLQEKGVVQVKSVEAALAHLSRRGEGFDLVFLDPPYSRGLASSSLNEIEKRGILSRCGFLVVEHEKKVKLPDLCGFLSLVDRREYGDTAVSFFSPTSAKANDG